MAKDASKASSILTRRASEWRDTNGRNRGAQ